MIRNCTELLQWHLGTVMIYLLIKITENQYNEKIIDKKIHEISQVSFKTYEASNLSINMISRWKIYGYNWTRRWILSSSYFCNIKKKTFFYKRIPLIIMQFSLNNIVCKSFLFIWELFFLLKRILYQSKFFKRISFYDTIRLTYEVLFLNCPKIWSHVFRLPTYF